jgi:hypothetical protein
MQMQIQYIRKKGKQKLQLLAFLGRHKETFTLGKEMNSKVNQT